MSIFTEIGAKIYRKWTKIRLQPIRVFCFHHVCAQFDAETMAACDWMQIDAFKNKVTALQQSGVMFITLSEAYAKMANDKFRNHKYAVLTFDDGYASLKEILPWLKEQHIPSTLFINGKYLDGESYRKNPQELYLTKNELWTLSSPLIEIGNHGWEHKRVAEQTKEEFEKSVGQNIDLLSKHPNYVTFWAYAYGVHTDKTDIYLRDKQVVPVYVDGMQNYDNLDVIHRELLLEE